MRAMRLINGLSVEGEFGEGRRLVLVQGTPRSWTRQLPWLEARFGVPIATLDEERPTERDHPGAEAFFLDQLGVLILPSGLSIKHLGAFRIDSGTLEEPQVVAAPLHLAGTEEPPVETTAPFECEQFNADAPRPSPVKIPYTARPGVEWNVNLVGADQSRWTGAGVRVAVLDSGFGPTAPWMPPSRMESIRVFCSSENGKDVRNHGTSVASILGGPPPGAGSGEANEPCDRFWIASRARLYIAKIASFDEADEGAALEAMNWAIHQGCVIANLAFVTPRSARRDQFWSSVIERALQRGLVTIAAVGNCSARPSGKHGRIGNPAAARSAIAVSAVSREVRDGAFWLQVHDLASRAWDGDAVHLVAPSGVTALGSDSNGNYITNFTRTSCATPHVSGVAALIAQRDKSRGARLRRAILRSALPLGGLDRRDVGNGLIRI